MAAKKFTKAAINWKELEQRVPSDQRGKFLAFKAKSDVYLRRIEAHLPELPKINWEEYKKHVPVAGLVEKFQREYEAVQIPYPEDKLSAEVDKQWAALEPEIKQYGAEMEKHINFAVAEIKKINALPKCEEMTMEMVYDLYPDQALNPVKKPTFWPHTPDEQLGYVDPSTKVQH